MCDGRDFDRAQPVSGGDPEEQAVQDADAQVHDRDDAAGDEPDDRRQDHQPHLAAAHQRAQPVGHRKAEARQEPRWFVCGDVIDRHGGRRRGKRRGVRQHAG